MSFPTEIRTAIRQAAKSLGQSLDFHEWPNGETNSPPHEVNALVHLLIVLTQADPTYKFYMEDKISTRGRADVIISNGMTSLAIEAKTFGNITERSNSVSDDLKRLQDFQPAYFNGDGSREINDWWGTSQQRWGMVLITSFRGDEVREAWVTDDENVAREKMMCYQSRSHRRCLEKTGFMKLRSTSGLCRFAEPVELGERWSATGAGHLLCGAVSLPNNKSVAYRR